MSTRYFIGLGSVMWVDDDGHERFIPISVDRETGLEFFEGDEFEDGNFADLDLVGDEPINQQTLSDYWDNIKKISNRKKEQ